MKVIYQSETTARSNNDVCTVVEYNLDSRNKMNIAIVDIKGRYPASGSVFNTKCQLIAYVNLGGGTLNIKDQEIALAVGDAVLIEPGEKYFWNGNMKLFVSCTPTWYLEQHKHIEFENNQSLVL